MRGESKPVIIHIGAPRTATTALQKHLFPSCQNWHVIQKRPFEGSVLREFSLGSLGSLLKSLSSEPSLLNLPAISHRLYAYLETLVFAVSIADQRDDFRGLLKELLAILVGRTDRLGIIISSERLCDTRASLVGDSKHAENAEKEFYVYALASVISEMKINYHCVVCLRSPIDYLCSKYIRTHALRRDMGLRSLHPNEYIEKQIYLESSFPGSSALAVAFHSDFARSLMAHMPLKAFGFRDLMVSEDVFSLMGITAEMPHRFGAIPIENKTPCTPQQRKEVQAEIKATLSRHRLDTKILARQMYA